MAKRIHYQKIYKTRGHRRLFLVIKIVLAGCLALTILGAIAGASVFIYFAKDLPRPEKFTERSFSQSTKIYDRTGQVLLYELYGDEKRDIVPLDMISDNLKNAVIAAEDDNFYSHFGIDIRGIIRSILSDLKLQTWTYGGSTISQQLIRSTFLGREKTVSRKIREVVLTLELERRYSKNQILEWYLNQIPFGPNIYGAQAAAQTYFRKSAKELNTNESAALAAMIKAPSYLSPYGNHKDELIARKNYVLDRMVATKYLDEKTSQTLKKEELKFSELTQSIKAPHFVFYIWDYLFEKYGRDFLENEGLKVYTTMDWDLQQAAEKAVADGVKRNRAYNSYNAALVTIDPKTGQVLTMVGSADWFGEPLPKGCAQGVDCLFDPKLNVATYFIGRQPGSSFKPFVYAAAFEKGYSDKYVVTDEETNFGIWGGKPYIPQNYDGRFRGPVTLRSALAQSLNVPSVKVLVYLAGISDSLETARKMGITTLNRPESFYGASLVLGGGEVKLLDMVSAYGVFATEGQRVPPVSILKIEDSEGNILEESAKTPRKVLSTETCRLINDILSDNEARTPIFGPRSPMYFADYQVAAKTGTTSDFRDGWIIGYTPSIAVGVWVGNNDNEEMYKETGIFLAGPVWRSFMDYILPKVPKENFIKPQPAISPPTNLPTP